MTDETTFVDAVTAEEFVPMFKELRAAIDGFEKAITAVPAPLGDVLTESERMLTNASLIYGTIRNGLRGCGTLTLTYDFQPKENNDDTSTD